MATVINELGALCHTVPGHAVQMQAADMLVDVTLASGRHQTVKVWSGKSDVGPEPVVRLQSRAAIVKSPRIIRDALRYNAKFGRAGFALDIEVDPPALDVVCALVVDPRSLPINDFLNALHEVASLADRIEAKLANGADEF